MKHWCVTENGHTNTRRIHLHGIFYAPNGMSQFKLINILRNNWIDGYCYNGKTTGQKGGHIVVKASEPSYLIGIVSLTPRVDYCQGNDFDTTLETLDGIHKPALDAIGFQDRMCETLDWRSVRYNADGSKTNGSIGKQPAWIDYMTNFNKTYGNFAIKDNEAFMVLNRWFESNPKTQEGDYTSYIDPQKYNYIFADTDLNAMNFWVQLGVSIKTVAQI